MKMRDNNPNNNMESFYDAENAHNISGENTQQQHNLKRPLTLDLNAGTKPQLKKHKFNASVNPVSVLNSPDLQLLKLASPELEKFMLANNTLQTPTPSLVYPTKVTSEQEDYAKGFVDALNSLRNCDNSQQQQQQVIVSSAGGVNPVSVSQEQQSLPVSAPSIQSVVSSQPTSTTSTILGTVGISGGSLTYTNFDDGYVQVKDEPQTVPNSPPHSPIDMEDQERIKLERKRQRNRVAASKCRKRKLERISKLEDKVKNLKGENTELGSVLKQLKSHVFQLKKQVIDHIQTGCNIVYNESDNRVQQQQFYSESRLKSE